MPYLLRSRLTLAAAAALFWACAEGGPLVEKRTSDFPIIDRYRAPGKGPVDLAYGAGSLWLANADGAGSIYRLNPTTGDVLSSVGTDYGPPAALCSDGAYLYVTAADTGVVHKHTLGARLDEVASFPTALANVRAMFYDAGKFYVFDQDTEAFYEFDGDFTPGPSHAVSPTPQWLRGAAHFKGRTWAADNRDGWINLYGANNWNVATKYCTPGWHPAGLAWDGAYLYLGDSAARLIYKLDVSSAP